MDTYVIEGPVVEHWGHQTPLGVLHALAEQPDSVHVFKDARELLEDVSAVRILRAAANGRVIWKTARESHDFKVSGKIILEL